MLVKEELLRELILLLLRSLENRNPRGWGQLGPISPHCPPHLLSCNGVRAAAWQGPQGSSRALTQGDGSNATVSPLPHAQPQRRL